MEDSSHSSDRESCTPWLLYIMDGEIGEGGGEAMGQRAEGGEGTGGRSCCEERKGGGEGSCGFWRSAVGRLGGREGGERKVESYGFCGAHE